MYPTAKAGPLPNTDLPESIQTDFNEARTILDLSPRSASALARLCIEKLVDHLQAEGKTLNAKIGNLVQRGLPDRVQKMLDIVRVIGNNAVHPGEIDLQDDQNTAIRLLELVNMIATKMITEPKAIDDWYDQLPEGPRKGIESRDKTNE